MHETAVYEFWRDLNEAVSLTGTSSLLTFIQNMRISTVGIRMFHAG